MFVNILRIDYNMIAPQKVVKRLFPAGLAAT